MIRERFDILWADATEPMKSHAMRMLTQAQEIHCFLRRVTSETVHPIRPTYLLDGESSRCNQRKANAFMDQSYPMK